MCYNLIMVLRWSLPHGSNLGNSQKVQGSEFENVLFWPPLPWAGMARRVKLPGLGHHGREGRKERGRGHKEMCTWAALFARGLLRTRHGNSRALALVTSRSGLGLRA